MAMNNLKSRIIHIGNLPLGGNHPVRIQSMTSTNTMDTEATVAQSIRMIEAGCEIVRITAPGVKEAENLAEIKKELKKRGYEVPLIADIHYQPKAAEISARIVEKVRINPGNYVDRKKGKIQYTDSEYQAEIEKIRERIKPLINICKENGTALRIGSNHGSLSERILLKYGDTPAGMVESALEFVRICRDLDFHNIVLSMKASNVRVMVQANRLLVQRMMEENMDYPIHLGVTEAGDGEDGRMKSAAGIGPLLEEGIGDTVRVSLTEEPENEIPVAKRLVRKANFYRSSGRIPKSDNQPFDPFIYSRRKTETTGQMGGDQPPVVTLSSKDKKSGFSKDFIPDYFFNLQTGLLEQTYGNRLLKPAFISSPNSFETAFTKETKPDVFIFDISNVSRLSEVYEWFQLLDQSENKKPVILKKHFGSLETEDMLIKAAAELGYFLVDGLGDGIWLGSKTTSPEKLAEISFGILQATRSRMTKTEFIACPSCGRTLFNIQETLQRIKQKTGHLKGLKIGVMGCCVNGPGEMADADYGYVGAGRGKVTLYKQKKIVEHNIPEEQAIDELIHLIKLHGDWMEK
ncbi:MAG: (E)-4-hydroxy-3-methylbut-2-enyl-diphosphate synthase [Bacteroidales bacterium]|nr:(E)-4-hydroxy-3-methylbut-2-enyl-diphosphate synthase [Bacteroidales bacterium]